MRSKFNFLIRLSISIIFELTKYLLFLKHFFERKFKYVKPQGLVKSYEMLETDLQKVFDSMGEDRGWAQTSGTRSSPKKIPFNKKRTNNLRLRYLEAMMVITSQKRGLRTFFVFSSLKKDHSLTASLIEEKSTVPFLSLLQAPYRFLKTSLGLDLLKDYDPQTLRLALILVTRPRFIYATNPSTIVHFLDELKSRIEFFKSELFILKKDKRFQKNILSLEDGDALGRIDLFLQSDQFSVSLLFEKLQGIITWTGGYVYPFIKRLQEFTPVPILPMFSMSTEGIETFPHLIGDEIIYGPFLPEVFCEYQELGAGDKLLSSHELKLHHEYLLILSDNYGLTRYNTGDIFKVTKIINGYPNLEFLRRREMTSSLTGEKITEQQVLALFSFLRLNDPSFESVFMTVFPALLNGEAFYVLGVFSFSIPSDFQEKAQDFLANENIEYKEKVESGRLKDLRVKSFDLFSFAKLMKSEDSMESQFKILPLYERPIELDQEFLTR